MSIGSLDAASGAEIEYIHMRRVYVYQCTQMLMIKTWPGGTGAVGYVRNSIFEDFWAYDTTYALDIDQYWYDHTTPNTGAIEISSLIFSNWTGTVDNGISHGPIIIRGSNIVPLTNITLQDFAMWTVNKNQVVLQCRNVYGTGYCARELASGATPTEFSSTVTMTTTMSGYVVPTSPTWAVAGYGTTISIPVYTPAALLGTVSVEAMSTTTNAIRQMTITSSSASTTTVAVPSTATVTKNSWAKTTSSTTKVTIATTLISSKIATPTITSAPVALATSTIPIGTTTVTTRPRTGASGKGGRGFCRVRT